MKTLLLCLLLGMMPGTFFGQADIGEETARITEVQQVESVLEEEERLVSGDLELDGSYDTGAALSRLWERFLDVFAEGIKKELGFAWRLVLIGALSCIVTLFSPEKRIGRYSEMAACSAASLLLVGKTETVIPETEAVLYRLSDYAKAAFPAFFGTVAACGAGVSASVKYASVCFVSGLYMELSQRILLPLIYAYLAAAITGSLAENALLRAVERFLKWGTVTTMTALTSAFCTYISLTGILSGSADAAAVKAAKSVISTVLPVVGGILSDSAASVLAAATVIKNSAGVFCLMAVCAICAGPFALLLVKMLLLKGAAAISEMGSSGSYSRLLSAAGNAMAMLLGLVGSYGVMLFYSFMSGLKVSV